MPKSKFARKRSISDDSCTSDNSDKANSNPQKKKEKELMKEILSCVTQLKKENKALKAKAKAKNKAKLALSSSSSLSDSSESDDDDEDNKNGNDNEVCNTLYK